MSCGNWHTICTAIINLSYFFLEIIIKVTESQPGLHNLWQFGSRAVRKWRENEKMKRKWRENEEMERKWKENEEMERDSLSTFPHFLFISSLSIHFLYKKLSHFFRKTLHTALLSRMSQKTYHTCCAKMILGRIRCKKVAPACMTL